MFKKIVKQTAQNLDKNSSSVVISPFDAIKKAFLNRLSKHALSLYEKKSDIKNFTKLALSDPLDNSHDEIAAEVFGDDKLLEALSEGELFDLTDNENFLKDLGL